MFICALCKKPQEKLIDSHLLPKAAYKRARDMNKTKSHPLILMDSEKATAVYTDIQIQQHLLCRVCEDLFSRKGERIMGTLWATSEEFKLLDIVMTADPIGINKSLMFFSPNILSAQQKDAMFYFCISVIWRSNVWPGMLNTAHKGTLGDKYEQALRQYLYDGVQLKDVKLLVWINTAKNLNSMLSFPVCHKPKKAMVHVHRFDILGITFELYIGKDFNRFDPLFDSIGSNMVLISADMSKGVSFNAIAESVQTKLRKVGKLAAD